MTLSERVRIGLARPVRLYLRHTPVQRGRGFIYFRILPLILPPSPAGFDAGRPDGSRIRLSYREVLGLVTFVSGGFEEPESRLLSRLARDGTIAFDVGANIGIHTIPLARAMPGGTVVAIEPLPANARRLVQNAEANKVGNIRLVQASAGPGEGQVILHLSDDPAFGSTTAVHHRRATSDGLMVQQTTLDRLWEDADRPPVSVVKIDIEGGELGALQGARRMLETARPPLLIETQGAARGPVVAFLATCDYRPQATPGLEPWNVLFRHSSDVIAPDLHDPDTDR